MSKLHADKGQPFVRVYTAMLNDDDLLDCGNSARLLAVLCLLWSADQGTAGEVPATPKRIQRFAHLDGGVDDVAAAVAELVAARFLVTTDDPDRLLIRSYTRFQTDLGGSSTRSENSKLAADRRWHVAGKHEVRKVGCPLCTEGVPNGSDGTDTPAERSPGTNTDTEPLTAKQVNADLWARFTDELDGTDPLETYLALADAVVAAAAGKYADVPRVTETTLLNLVVSHAIQSLWSKGDKLAAGVERQAWAWRRDHGTEETLTAIVKAAAAQNPASYCAGILRNGQVAA